MDRRIAKTQKALIAALGECLAKYHWKDVSVQLLCDTADISRSTFYAHYDDKQELLAHGIQAMASGLVNDNKEDRDLDLNCKIRIFPALLTHMRDHLFLFETTRASMAGRELSHHFETIIGQLIRSEIAASRHHQNTAEHKIIFLIGGIFAVLDDWRENNCQVPDQQILEILDQVTELVLPNRN